MAKVPVQKGRIEVPITSKQMTFSEKVKEARAEDVIKRRNMSMTEVVPKRQK